jgi:4-amino-4-deoxy-L-arabinose transferase-like glycosyltransferase
VRKVSTAIAVLVVIASGRMAMTYRVFSETADEATHIGSGLELIEFHRNALHRENPPLPRLIVAAAPWLGGMRFNPNAATYSAQLHSVFYDHGDYERNLMLARAGNLVFFILAAVALAAWTRRELGGDAAIIATLLFTTQPIILGYSALATHEAAATAGIAVVLLAMSRWLEERSNARTAQLALAFAFSVLCKFSCLGYAPLACAAVYVVRLARDENLRHSALRDVLRIVAIVPPLAALAMWAGYGFTIGRIADLYWKLPAPTFFAGVSRVIEVGRGGYASYAFGQVTTSGWWWYFPAAVALKTTLAFLLLVIAGARWGKSIAYEGLVASLAILAIAMTSKVDIGVRYVLPMYVPLTFAATASALAMLRDPRRVIRAAATALLATHVVVSAIAHPDYFPFFNALAGREPSRRLIDSNIDWGQDVLRLRAALRELHVTHVSTALFGAADLDALGFPPHDYASAERPSRGWIAVSENSIRLMGWSWLADRPHRKIGRSIRLYYVR